MSTGSYVQVVQVRKARSQLEHVYRCRTMVRQGKAVYRRKRGGQCGRCQLQRRVGEFSQTGQEKLFHLPIKGHRRLAVENQKEEMLEVPG